MKITALRVYTDKDNEDIIETIIENENLDILGFSSIYDEKNINSVCIEIYSEKEQYAITNKKIIEDKAKEIEIEVSTDIRELAEDEYLYAYQEFLKPIQVGDITIVPTSKELYKGDGKIIYIQKQYAFGTGTHETTQIALELIHDYCQNKKMENLRIADIGCGSGILSLATSLYGAFDITAIDNDPMAVSCTKDNMRYNEIALARVIEGEADTLMDEGQKYDLTIANIETEVLLKILPSLCAITEENGFIILSGILKERIDDMIYRIEEMNLKIVETKSKTEWTGMLLSFK